MHPLRDPLDRVIVGSALEVSEGLGFPRVELLDVVPTESIHEGFHGRCRDADLLDAPLSRASESRNGYDVERFDVAQVATGWLSSARFGSRGEKTAWQLRLLTRAGIARRLPLAIDDVEHLRYIADRLNATLEEMRTAIGYRDERMLPPAA